jgi:hypothetical protein
MFRKWLQARSERKQKAEEARRNSTAQFEAELLNPQFGVIEEVYGKPISQSLRALYEDTCELRKSYVEKVISGKPVDQWIFVSCYWPLNRAHVDRQWSHDGKHYAFAGDGSGSEWVVDPTDDEAEISLFEHEAQELKPTGVTMAQFRSLPENIEEA